MVAGTGDSVAGFFLIMAYERVDARRKRLLPANRAVLGTVRCGLAPRSRPGVPDSSSSVENPGAVDMADFPESGEPGRFDGHA